MNASGSWFALHTQSRYESNVKNLLMAKGYECFLPTYRRKRVWSGRVVESELPLFPSYLFCRFDPRVSSGTGRVLTTHGVRKVLSFGGKPSAVCEREIESLQVLMQASLPHEPWNNIPVGTRVRIESGPLKGVEGISLSNCADRKVLLSVSILQRSVSVSLRRDVAVSVLDNSFDLRTEHHEPNPFAKALLH
jgi:transcription antitermination factor NusG